MRRARSISGVLTVVVLAMVVPGCGGGSGTTSADVPQISFKSAAILGSSMPARYTCDGRNSSPPLEWGGVPPGTRELALLAIGLKPAGSSSYSVSIEWAVAGLNPALHRLPAGKLPAGAHLGSTSDGGTRYSVCPAKGERELYQFTLYAVPSTITIPAEFTGLQVLAEIGAKSAQYAARARGSFDVSYKRKS